ncbi:histidine phosphatase family protein [Corynebacterium choanae]|uniref:Glucosyl-3-phosphoglycerate phosphatase n=1 Tax=Corynebacterium choanae TaxID=1862358 RepID=A0A3G6J7Z0_9CORY|nr:histidine phosphatase family protein [Corynebacterium choanae]AZA14106.1 Glucosyl-3-phosphoglycerate phosphatase [Corynebacterium choanae]
MSRRLLLIRHGETEHNRTGRLQGQLDVPLSAAGRQQADRLAAGLVDERITRIYSSDLSRAFDTAASIGAVLGVDVRVERRFRETDLGQWQDKSREFLDEHFPGQRARWRRDVHWAPPGAETHLEVGARGRAAIDEIMAEYDHWDGNTVVVVGHGGLITATVANLLGLEPHQLPMFQRLGNTCWAELEARPPFVDDDAGELVPTTAEDGSLRFTPETVEQARWMLTTWNGRPPAAV